LSAPSEARLGIRQGCTNRLQDTVELGVIPVHSKTASVDNPRVELRGSQSILPTLLRLGILTALEFVNQVLRNAAEIGEVRTDPMLPAELESAGALGSEVRPLLPLLVSHSPPSRRPRSRGISSSELTIACLQAR
jgi:hypothetical protein